MDSCGRGEASRLAKACGVSRQCIHGVLSGERPASESLAGKISKATGGMVDPQSVMEHYYIEITLQVPRVMMGKVRDGDVIKTRIREILREGIDDCEERGADSLDSFGSEGSESS
tara:strand:- start:1140 stop:1484 length:345 start_codon:yes stop_codon:yes gene_type:complete